MAWVPTMNPVSQAGPAARHCCCPPLPPVQLTQMMGQQDARVWGYGGRSVCGWGGWWQRLLQQHRQPGVPRASPA
eukprot:460375-Pelagomonas_calceolata.AAC.1